MASESIHFLAIDVARARLEVLEGELEQAYVELDEAIKLGDLSENSEYDAKKETVNRLIREREDLREAISMPLVKAPDNTVIIQEGSIIELTVYGLMDKPYATNSPEFLAMKDRKPEFKGVVMLGGALHFHELLKDKMLKLVSPIGRYLIGKDGGSTEYGADHVVGVSGGMFSAITVKLLKPSEVTQKDLYCDGEAEEVRT